MQLKKATGFVFPVFLLAISSVSPISQAALAADKTKEVKVRDLTLQVPTGWVKEEPKSRLRLAQFRIPGKDGKAGELLIFSFGASGVEANIRRWINQYEPEGRTTKIFSGDSEQGKYFLVDLSGTYKKPVGPPIAGKTEPTPNSGTLAVILVIEDKGVYYLKLNGPKELVAAQREPLRKAFGADIAKEKEHTDDKE